MKRIRKRPACDYHGNCRNLAHREVYPMILKGCSGWSYLCRKHFLQENKKFNGKLPNCELD